MEISFVVAASENNVIGKNNNLPWHLPKDLRFFKEKTSGKPVLMGRKTFESLGKPLPNRLNIVVSQHLEKAPEGVLLFPEIQAALDFLREKEYPELSIIGGGQIFTQTIGIADVLFVTRVHTTIEGGNAFFPEIDKTQWALEWEERHEPDERHAYAYTFQKWVHKPRN